MFNFDKKTELVIQSIAAFGAKTATQVFFVGGMVRDALMGIDIKDIDILVEGSAIDFIENFARKYDSCCDNPSFDNNCNNRLDVKIKSVHESFNTAKTAINGIEIDFASTREEEYPKSGCLPVVTKTACPIKDDLKRRDFTANAIAAKLSIQNDRLKYELIDPFEGAIDIKNKTLKILHDKSYIDDPTRILRGLDFILRFGFDFDKHDKLLIEEYLKSPDREGLSIDRVKLTLKKLFSAAERAKEAYTHILDKKYYKIWEDFPGFKKEWAQRLDEAVQIFNANPSKVFMAAIFENDNFLENQASKNHAGQNTTPKTPKATSNYEIYNSYKTLSNEDLALRYALLEDTHALYYFKNLKDIKPDFTGEDLIKEGFTQGKKLGEELKKRFEKKLNALPKLYNSEP